MIRSLLYAVQRTNLYQWRRFLFLAYLFVAAKAAPMRGFHLSAMALRGTTSQVAAAAVVRAIDQDAGGAAVGTHLAKGDFLRPHGQISRRAVVCKWGKRAWASRVGLVDHPVNWIPPAVRVELLIAAC
jgi:hypothetical protein